MASKGMTTVERVEDAIRAVLPTGTPIRATGTVDEVALVDIGITQLRAAWAGEGWLGDVRHAIARHPVDVVVAQRMSPGARVPPRPMLAWVGSMRRAEPRSRCQAWSSREQADANQRSKAYRVGRHR